MLTKNNQQRQNWITKRKAENETRRQNGQEELPLDEVKKCLSNNFTIFMTIGF